MKIKLSIADPPCSRTVAAGCRLPIESGDAGLRLPSIANRKSQIANGFTLIEMTVVVILLALIVLALMAVFSGTQTAFRAGITQSDVLESGRATMDLMVTDLREMSPSLDVSNGAVNFCVTNSGYSPLIQSLVASSQQRTNILENFFILSRGNQNGVPTWYGTGYAVYLSPTNLYSLYRFSASYPVASSGALENLVTNFQNFIMSPTIGSHLMDGVVELRVRAYDVNGGWMTDSVVYSDGQPTTNENVFYSSLGNGETGFEMSSNTLPAAVEIEMGVLEDRTLQRAESLSGSPAAQSNYLAGAAGQVHIFRQRVSIPNVDLSAYQ